MIGGLSTAALTGCEQYSLNVEEEAKAEEESRRSTLRTRPAQHRDVDGDAYKDLSGSEIPETGEEAQGQVQ